MWLKPIVTIVIFQADELLKQRLGDEENLFAELVKKYGVEEDPAFSDLVSQERI